MPASLDLVDALRADGVPAIVSGAGPTVLAFTDTTDGLMARCPDGGPRCSSDRLPRRRAW